MKRKFDPIVPVKLSHGLTTPRDLRKIREKYGIRRFFVCGPGIEVHITGYPGMEVYEQIAETILNAKKELADTDIEIYWWCAPSLNMGKNAPYQHIVNYDGTVSDIGLCPLDTGMRLDFSKKVARVAELAHPEIIQFEDDYELSNHPGVTVGCFCPLHLAEFAKKTGRSWTREQLIEVFRENRKETRELRRIFAEQKKESLCLLASDIRNALDHVAPETRISVCEPATTDADGYLSVDEPRIFAGKNTVPLIRLYGSAYSCSDSPQGLPRQTAHTMYSAECLPEDYEWMHESDTFPHTTFYMSSAYLETEIHAALAMGADNSLLYAGQYLDDPAEDPSYFEMYRKNAKRFEAIRKACRGGKLDGCRIIHHPEMHAVEGSVFWTSPFTGKNCSLWQDTCCALGRMGFPYSTKYGSPAILAGYEADYVSDEEILELLKGGLMLDSTAAAILSRRGFGNDIGTDVKPLQKILFSQEKMADIPDFAHIRGRNIYNFAIFPSGLEETAYCELVPHDGAEALSYYLDPTGKVVQPGLVRYTNRLGGRIAVMASSFWGNNSSNLFSLRKQEIFRILFSFLRGDDLPASAADAPGIWLLCRNTQEGVLLFVTSLSCDGRNDVRLHVSRQLSHGVVEEISENGEWQKASVERSGNEITLKGDFPVLRTRVFRIPPES